MVQFNTVGGQNTVADLRDLGTEIAKDVQRTASRALVVISETNLSSIIDVPWQFWGLDYWDDHTLTEGFANVAFFLREDAEEALDIESQSIASRAVWGGVSYTVEFASSIPIALADIGGRVGIRLFSGDIDGVADVGEEVIHGLANAVVMIWDKAGVGGSWYGPDGLASMDPEDIAGEIVTTGNTVVFLGKGVTGTAHGLVGATEGAVILSRNAANTLQFGGMELAYAGARGSSGVAVAGATGELAASTQIATGVVQASAMARAQTNPRHTRRPDQDWYSRGTLGNKHARRSEFNSALIDYINRNPGATLQECWEAVCDFFSKTPKKS